MEEDIGLERHFKSIIDPLKQIIENCRILQRSYHVWNNLFRRRRGIKTQKKMTECFARQILYRLPCLKSVLNRLKTVSSTLNEMSEIIQSRKLSYDHAFSIEEIFEVVDKPLVTSIRQFYFRRTKWAVRKLVRWDKNIWKWSWTVRKSSI